MEAVINRVEMNDSGYAPLNFFFMKIHSQPVSLIGCNWPSLGLFAVNTLRSKLCQLWNQLLIVIFKTVILWLGGGGARL